MIVNASFSLAANATHGKSLLLNRRLKLLQNRKRNEVSGLVLKDCVNVSWYWSFNGVFYDQNRLLYDKVTVLESEKRAWENSPEAQAIREALDPWKNNDAQARKNS
nr:hypothetical protein CFP56_39118 [Quercus suber]